MNLGVEMVGPEIVEDNSESTEVEHIQLLVQEAKQKLRNWVDAGNEMMQIKAKYDLGLSEGLYSNLTLAALDKNGDDTISETEVQEFKEGGEKLVDGYLSSLMNGGVTTALIFSVIFPTAYELEISKDSGIWLHLEYLAMQAGVLTAIASIFISAVVYLQLSFFVPTTLLKMWYCKKLSFLFPIMEGLKNACLFEIAIGYMCHQMHVTYFPFNLLSILPLVVLLIAFYYLFPYINGQVIDRRLFDYTQDILKRKKKILMFQDRKKRWLT